MYFLQNDNSNSNNSLTLYNSYPLFPFSFCMNFDNLDNSEVNKGSMLYAAPHFLHYLSLCDHHLNHQGEGYMPFPNPSNLAKQLYFMYIYLKLFKLTKSHLECNTRATLVHDIETNPGPTNKTSLKIMTLNCRGLGDINKCRLLLNKIVKLANVSPTIVMLQETMILTDNYIKLAWRGKYVYMPGMGNSQGCITLLPSSADITAVEHFNNRGQCALVTGLLANADDSLAIYNIYAPNGFGQEKIEFINLVFDRTANSNGPMVLGGDINTTLSNNDRHKGGVTAAELRVADLILDKVMEHDLQDTWTGIEGFTWRRGQVMSKLDRIFYRLNNYSLYSNAVDWTITSSDHAAVIAVLEHHEQVRHKNKHIKLDNDIIKNPIFLNEIKTYLIEQLESANYMNPHTKLEFAKMSIRTVTLAIMKRERQREISELNEINNDIITNTELLTRVHSPHDTKIKL
jgi:hypothetical protein